MARAAILREVGGVFSAYKIDVDIRHLELIADYMVSTQSLVKDRKLMYNRLLMVDTSRSIERVFQPIRRHFLRRRMKLRLLSCRKRLYSVTLMTFRRHRVRL